jgi:hypothetical protein
MNSARWREDATRLEFAWAYLSAFLNLSFNVVLWAGAFAGALGWRPAALLMLIAVFGLSATHLAVGVVAYRHTMSRPWPAVPPIPADDDDW